MTIRLRVPKEELLELYSSQGLPQWKIGEIYGVTQQTISRWMKKYQILTKDTRYKPIEPNLSPSPPLSYVLGVLKGDGYICFSKKWETYRIELTVTSHRFAESFSDALQKLGLNPNIHSRKPTKGWGRKLLWIVQAYSKIFVRWYKQLDKDSFLSIVKTYPVDFLRGFYESEGSLWSGIDNRWKRLKGWIFNRIQLGIHNKDKCLLGLVKDLCLKIGVHAKIYPRFDGTYVLRVNKKNDIYRFLEIVEPCIKNANQVKDNKRRI